MHWLFDIFVFNLIHIPCIWLLSAYKEVSLIFIIFIFCGIFGYIIQRVLAYIKKNNCKSYSKPSWTNWFEISKFFGGILGIILITYCRYYSIYSHYMTLGVLGINIGEAILSDFSTNGIYNAIAGFILFINSPFHLNNIKQYELQEDIKKTGIFKYSVSISWILCYTSWNAAFSFGFNYSPSTRLMLITSLIISFCIFQDSTTWLGVRTYALMINMVFRYFQLTYLYIPGKSYITNINGTLNDSELRKYWGLINCIFVIGLTLDLLIN